MVAGLETLTRPTPGLDFRKPSRQRQIGIAVGVVGLVLAVIAGIGNFAAAGDVADGTAGETLRWTFGLSVAGLGTVKLGIAVILVGVLVRLWLRVAAVKETMPLVKAAGVGTAAPVGTYNSAFGKATATTSPPEALPIHKVARTMWFPMLAMGFMALVAGLVLALVSSGETNPGSVASLFAWAQGTMFLGEAMLLGGIAFLLGSILAAIRDGGGEVQESVGVTVKALKMPTSAKAFVGLMMVGMLLGIAQFALYIFVATSASGSPGAWFAWLGPLREVSLGVLLSSIVLALYTIGSALGFQFDRMKQIIGTGK